MTLEIVTLKFNHFKHPDYDTCNVELSCDIGMAKMMYVWAWAWTWIWDWSKGVTETSSCPRDGTGFRRMVSPLTMAGCKSRSSGVRKSIVWLLIVHLPATGMYTLMLWVVPN